MADQDHKRVIITKDKPSSLSDELDPKHPKHQEHVNNAMSHAVEKLKPLMIYAIGILKKKGFNTDEDYVYEAAQNGVMKALATHNPNRKSSVSSWVVRNVMNSVMDRSKPKDIASGDIARNNRALADAEKRKSSGEVDSDIKTNRRAEQTQAPMGQSNRALADTMGNAGGAVVDASSTGIEKDQATMLAEKLHPSTASDIKSLMAAHESRTKRREEEAQRVKVQQSPLPSSQPVSQTPQKPIDTEPTANLGEAKQIAPGKKIMVRRAADAIKTQDPVRHQRIQEIISARNEDESDGIS